ncbi:MAG TPA: LysR family transcriptional regulator [Burkholderiaceae bacterium]|jgi:DNA-binding transcriptional LysR family regulator
MKQDYAKTQSRLSLTDLELLLALVRGGTLAGAAERLRLDTSTVFRSIKRLEQNLNERLFERSKQGYMPTELAQELAAYAERIDTHLNEAREKMSHHCTEPSGVVRITTTDTILQGLVLPVLNRFSAAYPKIDLELLASNALANLSQRDADVAIRATKKPPENLVGLRLGVVENAVYIHRSLLPRGRRKINLVEMDWITLDDTLTNHPSYKWWRQHYPKAASRFRCNSVMSVAGAIINGLGVGVAPRFMMDGHPDVVIVDGLPDELKNDLWILAHPDIRHLQRVKLLFDFLKENVRL